ncbi:MAG: LamG domain-containing protein, partial [Sedimentisphaerales bacterium]|nr:LamG domain-containing protein [Sedimentisphaerales bacterium]
EILQALTPPQDDPSYDPNWVTGWISSETPNTALDFRDFGFVKVIPDPDSLDPNMTNMAWQISISAWMNAQDWVGNRRIMQKGLSDNQYRLLAEGGNLRFHLANVGTLDAPLPSAGTWHHVVATYDYSTMKIYVDGTERASLAASGLIGQTGDPLYIGAKSEAVNPVSYPGDYYKGQLDDIRLYSYALTADEVLALAVMGDNAPPTVSVVDPEDLVLSVTNYIQMDATAEDINDDTINYEWRATGPAAVTFDPSANVEDPKAVFTEAGTYTLRLTVDDGQAGLGDDIFAEVVVEVTNPGCDVVIELGYGMASDINEDCYVNLLDFAALAADWLECNNPLDDDCPNPFQQ